MKKGNIVCVPIESHVSGHGRTSCIVGRSLVGQICMQAVPVLRTPPGSIAFLTSSFEYCLYFIVCSESEIRDDINKKQSKFCWQMGPLIQQHKANLCLHTLCFTGKWNHRNMWRFPWLDHTKFLIQVMAQTLTVDSGDIQHISYSVTWEYNNKMKLNYIVHQCYQLRNYRLQNTSCNI